MPSPALQHGTQKTAAEQMHVQVKNLLSCVTVAVYQQPVPVFGNPFLFGDDFGNGEHMTDQGFVFWPDIVDRWYFFVGNDENMNGRLGIDVPEGRNFLILVYDV